jgi:DNA-binding transcriptional regulator YiaG
VGNRRWSEQEVGTLRRLYPMAPWVGLLAALPGRSRHSIHEMAKYLEIRRLKKRQTWWTAAEKNMLAKLYPRSTWPELIEALPRHPRASIAKMASMLRLRRADACANASPYKIIRLLRKIRREKGLTQIDLAPIVGTLHVQIAKWETGECVPRTRTLFDWVQALGYRLELVALASAER